MADNSLLIIGCGDLGNRAGLLCTARGWRVDAVRRHPDGTPADFRWHAADYAEAGSLAFAEALAPDFVLATFNPASRDVEGYRRGFADAARNLLAGLGEHRARRLLMVSSTRVYAEADGGWVNEASELVHDDPSALAIIEAERTLLDSDQPTTVLRCGGVYGQPGGRLVARVSQGRVAPERPVRYTNRIHREDCAGFIDYLLRANLRGEPLAPVYNVVDDDPAPAYEVEHWIADALGVGATEIARPERGFAHKRCSNAQLRASGYRLKYPDFRAGYGEMIAGN